MSERTFKNRTKEIDELLADPEFAAAIKEHRTAFEQADREYAVGLADVRHAFGLTQVELAQKLGTVQANVSKTESRQDLLLSTLANYFAAMGADDVKIIVRRGDREIEVAFDALTPQT
jgi:ribosome-binding protein aMBF1 (putative translation factor)